MIALPWHGGSARTQRNRMLAVLIRLDSLGSDGRGRGLHFPEDYGRGIGKKEEGG